MADATPAAPAAPAPAQAATEQVLKTLPDQQAPAQSARVDEVEDDGSDLPPEEVTKAKKKAEAAAAKKAYKLKVNGKDMEVDEGELIKRAQMGYSADQKWQETAQMKKQMDAFIGLLQKDPAKALEQMGFNVDDLAEARIKARIEEMQKSPEQLEREKLQRELEEMRERDRQREEDYRQKETQRLQDQFAIEIENDISSALETAGTPKTAYFVKRVADTMISVIQRGLETNNESLKNVKARDVVNAVKKQIQDEQREMYAISPDELFEELIGKDRLNKYRRAKIKKTAKPATTADVRPTGTKELQKAQEEQNKDKKKINAKDFFKNLGSR